jgi:hypothetical protein
VIFVRISAVVIFLHMFDVSACAKNFAMLAADKDNLDIRIPIEVV